MQLTIGSQRNLGVRVGFVSETGKRSANEDYVGACLGQAKQTNRDVVAAVADGVGGYRGGREAAARAPPARGAFEARGRHAELLPCAGSARIAALHRD